MSLRVVTEEGQITAFLGGEIDHHTAKYLREEIDDCAVRQKPERLVLDFREVTFMDSSGIGLVMGRYRLMQELGGELLVTGVPSHIKKVMRLSGLDKLAVMEPESKTRAKKCTGRMQEKAAPAETGEKSQQAQASPEPASAGALENHAQQF